MNDELREFDSVPDYLPPEARGFPTRGDLPPELRRFRADVVAGLGAKPKTLPSKYFYDARGSQLFEEICELPEYYLTRTETALLARIAPEIAANVSGGAALVEIGSGASTKTRLLLDAAPQIRHYVPIDISESALAGAAETIGSAYPSLTVTPLVQDFTQIIDLPEAIEGVPLVGFFPGSTIGNFVTRSATALLRRMRLALGPDALFIVGADLAKDPAVLIPAYDDSQGVTAAFNHNLLTRINRELAGTFDPETFRHEARWNAFGSRVESHLVSTRDQVVFVDGEAFHFARGESIHTENSHKYTRERFAHLAKDSGWRIERMWSSLDPAFGIFMLRASKTVPLR